MNSSLFQILSLCTFHYLNAPMFIFIPFNSFYSAHLRCALSKRQSSVLELFQPEGLDLLAPVDVSVLCFLFVPFLEVQNISPDWLRQDDNHFGPTLFFGLLAVELFFI